MEFHICSWGYD